MRLPPSDELIRDVERAMSRDDPYRWLHSGFVNGDGRPVSLDYAMLALLRDIRDELRALNQADLAETA